MLRRFKRGGKRDEEFESAMAILEVANIPRKDNGYNENDWLKIADAFPEYRFTLYTREPGHHIYSLFGPPVNPTAKRDICIAFHDQHFDFFKPTRKAIKRVICKACNMPYTHSQQHRCTFKCTKCHT